MVTIDGWVEVVATIVEVLAGWSEVATIDCSSEVVTTGVEVLARWSEIVIAANCVLSFQDGRWLQKSGRLVALWVL